MAGPAIRAVELASRLAAKHEVTLACPGASALPAALRAAKIPGPGADAGSPAAARGSSRSFAVRELAEGESLRPLLDELQADVLIAQGFGFPARELLALPSRVRLVVDLYDPVLLELLARAGGAPDAQTRLHLLAVRARLFLLLARADHVLCASERQRAFWLGWLGAAARLTPEALAKDPAARALLAVVPFGIEDGPCVADAEAPGAKALREAAGGAEHAILWWGGLWDWMDPRTAVRAIARLRAEGLSAALVLPAGNRPGAAPMRAAALADDEARRAGLGGSGVGRLSSWIRYAERGPLLAAASAAVSCHTPSLEAELAFRTRLLDCVWAGLPVAATAGDELSARAEREGWGAAISPGDDAQLAEALKLLLDPLASRTARAAALSAAPGYTWEKSAAPLLALLDAPAPARPSPANALLPELQGAAAGELAGAALGKLWRAIRK